MDVVRDQFVSAAAAALERRLRSARAAHGPRLPAVQSFLSPLTNLRDDEYGGSLAGRARFPLEVLDACRAVWPAEKPMSVRISATDWVRGRVSTPTMRSRSRGCCADHGCDIVDVSSGQVSPDRSSPPSAAATRRRSPTGSATRPGSRRSRSARSPATTTSTRSSCAGRADLCALARPHLYDPHWTLHAAAEQEFDRTCGSRSTRPDRAGRRRDATASGRSSSGRSTRSS